MRKRAWVLGMGSMVMLFLVAPRATVAQQPASKPAQADSAAAAKPDSAGVTADSTCEMYGVGLDQMLTQTALGGVAAKMAQGKPGVAPGDTVTVDVSKFNKPQNCAKWKKTSAKSAAPPAK